MDSEKYVKLITKNLKCSAKKSAEIKQQLLSDIHVRIEKGETWDGIIQDMGTPAEVSEEFNQNFSEEEQRAYKKKKRLQKTAAITSALLLLLLLSVLCIRWMLPITSEIGNSSIFSKDALEEKSKNIILLLNQNDFESLQADATDEMKAVLTPEKIAPARASIRDNWGQMESIGNIYLCELHQRGQVFAIAQIGVSYENTSATFTLMFDENMKLAGLYMK